MKIKKYRQVFDSSQTAYIYAELSFYNKLFDREGWEAEIELKCFEIKNLKNKSATLISKRKSANLTTLFLLEKDGEIKRKALSGKRYLLLGSVDRRRKSFFQIFLRGKSR